MARNRNYEKRDTVSRNISFTRYTVGEIDLATMTVKAEQVITETIEGTDTDILATIEARYGKKYAAVLKKETKEIVVEISIAEFVRYGNISERNEDYDSCYKFIHTPDIEGGKVTRI